MHPKLLILILALAMVACTHNARQQNSQQPGEQTETQSTSNVSQGEALLNILNADSHSLVVLNNDSLSFYNGRGVSDLLYLVSNEPERLKGAVVADKMIGKAAAALMVAGGVREVHTNLICKAAVEVFRQAGVPVSAKEEVEQILNRDRSAQCPIDALLNESDNIDECVNILRERFAQPQ